MQTIQPEKIITTISNLKTGEVYKSEEDWKAKGVPEAEIRRDVKVIMPSLDLLGKTKQNVYIMPLKKIGRAIKKTVRKVVPKEVAGIMTAAAPFVAPYSLPAAAALSIGGQLRTGQGRINPILTGMSLLPGVRFAGGDGLGAFKPTGFARFGQDFGPSTQVGLRGLLFGQGPGQKGQLGQFGETAEKFLFGSPVGGEYDKVTQGLLGKGGEYNILGSKLLSSTDDKGVIKLSPTKIAAAAAAGLSLTQTQAQIEEEADEAGLSSSELARLQQEAAEMWEDFDTTAFKPNVKDGGLMRVNLAMGSKGEGDELPPDPTTPVNPFKPKPIGPVLPNKKMAEFDIGEYFELFEKANPQFKGMDRNSDEYRFYFNDYWQGLANKKQEGDTMMAEAVDVDILRQMFMEALKNGEIPPGTDFDTYKDMMMTLMSKTQAKKGGLMRTNYALGTEPTSEESGLGGLPIEADMRYSGGFMPYGAKEKADDVPARLSKNEFVFTADAVRAAGGGSVQKGAQKMYNSMKQLEAMGRRMA